jgi:UDP-glucose 6-dehydrogenase
LDTKIFNSKKKKKIFFTNSIEEAIKLTDISFIFVGTPLKKNLNIDLAQIIDVTKKIESYLYPTLNKIDGSEVYYLAHVES